MKSSTNALRNERGIAVPLVAVCLVALIGLAAVGVDTGRVATVADELQMAADVAATAGTAALANEDDATAGANAALQLNKVNGAIATAALQKLEVGNMNASYTFTPNLAPMNAVRAQTRSVVNNILLDTIGHSQSTVTREAIATLAGIGSGIPTLPIVIGECHFNAQCYHQTCMPYLAQVPDPSNNSGWTAFFESASNNNIDHYFPAPCGGNVQQMIKVGDVINLGNGQTTPLLNTVQCLVNAGQHTFTIPIVECVGTFNQAKKVVGFAKIEVDYVIASGSPKGIWLRGLYEGQQPGTPGGGTFGLMAVMLVK
jgi:Flp pilus assembly protein TadG